MSYQNEIKTHLIAYKEKNFKGFSHGLWQNNPDNILKYAFVPIDRDYNLIETFQKEYLNYEKANVTKIKRHMYFHHMNSSQAMCLNFFFPLYKENCLELITDFLGFKDEKVKCKSVRFEEPSKIDSIKGSRPTNFDFYFETETGKKFFFEIKYTEYDFGKASDDTDHNKKYDNVYNTGTIFNPIHSLYREKLLFFKNYQIIRNLIHVAADSYVVFIYPKDNIKIKKQAIQAKTEMLQEPYDKHLFTIEWEDLFKSVNDKVKLSSLKNQMKGFGKKYFINSKIND
ncbi:PGN_0703 family putative restriction endonuclease [Yeosuana sp.]|uniref:PGN_0703 family putative restriction endonuclease n=1 Tax=Yeosuana sp. TaxID=2529388 RepID=UPI004054B322